VYIAIHKYSGVSHFTGQSVELFVLPFTWTRLWGDWKPLLIVRRPLHSLQSNLQHRCKYIVYLFNVFLGFYVFNVFNFPHVFYKLKTLHKCAPEDDCDSETVADWLNFVDTALRSLSITWVWRTFTEIISFLDKFTLLMMIAAKWCFFSWAYRQVRQWHTHSAAYFRRFYRAACNADAV